MTTISLILDQNESGQSIFRPGQLLKGTAILSLSNARKFRGLYIRVFGQAMTSFEVRKTARRYPVTEVSVEVYLNTKIYLFGRLNGPAFELKSGTHKYTFSCLLPEQIPNSTDLKLGSIEYFVEAVLEVPYKFDMTVKTPFFVDCDDLNFCQVIKQPVKRVELKNFSPNEYLCIEVMLPCSGFVAYQSIPITIFYENNSNASIIRTKIALIQSIEYRNKDGSEVRPSKNVLVENYTEGVNARTQTSVTTELIIPYAVMSNTKYCDILSVGYILEVDPLLCGIQANMKFEIPIIIGKIPMRSDPQRPPSIYATAPTQDQLDNELPPSYQELVKLNVV